MDLPFLSKRSLVRITPGVLMGPFPFDIEEASERVVFFPPTFSTVKFSNSDLDGPDVLEITEPPCKSSPTHVS